MDTKNILPRITASIHCPVIKLEKILFARFHTCARYLTGFSGNIAYIAFFYLLQELFFLQKDVAGEYKANGYIHCSSQKSHGDGHCGGNNVIDSVLQYAEYRIDYFFPAQCQETAPISQLPDCFQIHCRSIFWKTGIFFFYLFSLCLRMLPPSSGTTTSITITIIQITKQIESTRLTGLASFCAVFFLLFQGFSEQMMFYEFHWNIEDKSDSKTNDERKEKAKQNSDSADDYVQVLDTQI